MATEETSVQEDAAARPPGRPSIPPGTDDEANNGDPEDHQNGMTLFSAVLVPNSFNKTVEDTDYTRAHRQIGVVLTNEVYDGVLIPDQHEWQEELKQTDFFFKETISQTSRFSGDNHSNGGNSPCYLVLI